jgi:hypothetical protein
MREKGWSVVNEETLRKMVAYWDAKAERAFDTYQEAD